MDLHTSPPENSTSDLGADLSVQPPPTTTLPPGPRRIHPRRGWRRLRRVGLAAAAGAAGGLLTAWSLAGDALPALLRLPQPALALAAADRFVPMLLAAIGLVTLWRLSTWVLPLVVAGLLLGGGVPLLLRSIGSTSTGTDLLMAAPVLTALALPLMALVLNRALLRRLGLTGRLGGWREVGLFAGLAVVAAPGLAGLLAWGVLWLAGTSAAAAGLAALQLALAWALALVSAGTVMQASIQRPRRGSRRLAHGLAAAAVAAQISLSWWPDAGALSLLPHVLLCLHALQAAPRTQALLASTLLALWALCAPDTAMALGLGAGLA